MMHLKTRGTDIKGLGLKAADLAEIIKMTISGKLSGSAAKEVLVEHIVSGRSPLEIVKEKGLEQVSDRTSLDGIIDQVIAANRRSVDDFKNGKEPALGFLVGQVMKLSGGKANPKVAGEMLREKISSSQER
jgi:aspartyl-tRNA(Asn)/glutamyl-tRNA(Gln) amidotransferase subunit B